MEPTSPLPTDNRGPQGNFLIPIAIILAGAMIAGSLFYLKQSNPSASSLKGTATERPEENMTPVSPTEHILGSPNARVFMVEYSDIDCPYCQMFHPTLQKIMNEFGKNGEVAWVFRHFPISSLHPNAPKKAEAAECVAELGGNKKFWDFLNLLNVDPNKSVDLSKLPSIAASIGIDKQAFSTCLSSGKYTQKVTDSFNEAAVKLKAQGTPYTILVTRDIKVPITDGAIPYEKLRAAIKTLLEGK